MMVINHTYKYLECVYVCVCIYIYLNKINFEI